MPPKALKTGKGYFDRAWKPVITAQQPRWKSTTITSALRWLWASRTQAEEDECNQLVANASTNLPTIDPSILPYNKDAFKGLPHWRAAHRGVAVAPVGSIPGLPAQGPTQGAAPPQQAPATTKTPTAPANNNGGEQDGEDGEDGGEDFDLNTTRPAFWPTQDNSAKLPPALDDDDLNERWKDDGFFLQSEEDHESDWHGALRLGQGSCGRATAWVKLDKDDNILDRCAVKDSVSMSNDNWAHPQHWRDRFPRDIAIQKRLHDQGGLDSIHVFKGYRLNMEQQSYRLYNELCERGTYLAAFEYYSRHWRFRRNLYRMRTEGVFTVEEDRDHIRDIEQLKGSNIDIDVKNLPVIPEKFLWHTFLQLVDSCIFMRDGAGRKFKGKQWRPIVHRDIHLDNLFLKVPENCTSQTIKANHKDMRSFFNDYYTPPDNRNAQKQWQVTEFTADNMWPTAVLADWDCAMFDLQGPRDTLTDNPMFFLIPEIGRSPSSVHSRYPPDMFPTHERYATWSGLDWLNVGELPKISSSSDIWAIGQMMWNLIRNLPSFSYEVEAPSFDNGSRGRHLSNRQPYTEDDVYRNVLTGQAPFEASNRYSTELKDTVRSCLLYTPEARPGLEELRNLILLYMNDDNIATTAKGNLWIFAKKEHCRLRVGTPYTGQKRKRAQSDDQA